MDPVPVLGRMAVVSDDPRLRQGADETIVQIEALALPPDGGRPNIERRLEGVEGVHIENLMVEIRIVIGMTAVQDHVDEVVGVAVFNVQALAGILRPSNLATAIVTVALHWIEVESLILRILTRPDLDFVEVLVAATSNIHTCVCLACPSELKA